MLQKLKNDMKVLLYVRQCRMARFNTIRKCLSILLDPDLTRLAVDDSTLRYVTNHVVHEPNVFSDVVADALRSAEEIVDAKIAYVPGGGAKPEENLTEVVSKLTKLVYQSDNAFDSHDDALEHLIDLRLNVAVENFEQQEHMDDYVLLRWFDQTHPVRDPPMEP